MTYDPAHVAGPELPLYKLLGATAARIIDAVGHIPPGLEQHLVDLEQRLAPAFHPDTKWAAYSYQELTDLLLVEWLERRSVVRWLAKNGIDTDDARHRWPGEIVWPLHNAL